MFYESISKSTSVELLRKKAKDIPTAEMPSTNMPSIQLKLLNVPCLRSSVGLLHFKAHLVPLGEGLEPRHIDGRMVDE